MCLRKANSWGNIPGDAEFIMYFRILGPEGYIPALFVDAWTKFPDMRMKKSVRTSLESCIFLHP